jgi:hypothetical protein
MLVVAVFGFAQKLPLGSIPIGGLPLVINSNMPNGAAVTTTTSPWTWSFTNTSGTVLYLFVTVDGGTPAPTLTATYAGTSMTQLGTIAPTLATGNSGTLSLFRLTLPATGANNFVITWTNGTQVAIADAISFTGNATIPDSGTASTNSWTVGTTVNTFPLTVGSTTGPDSGNLVLQGVCDT